MPAASLQNPNDTTTSAPSIMDRQRAKIPAQAAADQPIPHDDLLKNIAAHFSPIDFRKVAGLPADGRITSKYYVLYTVKQALSQLESKGFFIGVINEGLYFYNRAFHKPLSRQDAKDIVQAAAVVFGVPEVDAESVDFRDKGYEQLSQSAPRFKVSADADTVKINMQNGTIRLDTKTGDVVLGAFSADDAIRYQLPYDYDPTATAPEFNKFLNKVQPDESCRLVMGEWQGYIFIPTARLKLEKTMLYTGTGSNGKSVMYDVIKAMLGVDNICSLSLEAITTQPTTRVMLADKLVNYASDISRKLDAANFKTLSSGEDIEARRLYQDPFMMSNYAKLQFNCNELPEMEHTHGFRRRFIIVPFNVTIPKEEQDVKLHNRIVDNELPGVFNWAIEGLKRLLQQGNFTESEAIETAALEYQESADAIMRFLKSIDGYMPHESEMVYSKDVFAGFMTYCQQWNMRTNVNDRIFNARMGQLGFKRTEKPGNGGVRFYASRNNIPTF